MAQSFSLADLASQSPQLAEMARLIQQGNKIGAIKIYRQVFGVGLKEAKDAVEDLAAGRSIRLPGESQSAMLSDSLSPTGHLTEIEQLVRAGKKIEAIKLYRELNNVGLKEAKDAVEQMRWSTPSVPNVLRSSIVPPSPSGQVSSVSFHGCLLAGVVFGSLLLIAVILLLR